MSRLLIQFLFTLFVIIGAVPSVQGQSAEIKADSSLWKKGGSIGLDLSQLALVNPKVGGGENKLALGGMNTFFVKYKNKKSLWESDATLQLAVQKLGSMDKPFTKNIDVFRLNSRYGYFLNKKLYASIAGGFETLLMNTYSDLTLSSNETNSLKAQFLSPATMTLSVGLDYVKDDNLSMMFSILSYKSTIVTNNELAALGVHGNPWESADDYKNIKHELGANFKAIYKNTFFKKLKYKGDLNLFYNYLADEHGIEFVDVIFINDFGVEIIKGFSVNLLFDLRWDRDIASFLGEDVIPDGLEEFRKWMITEAFVVKYNYTF